MQCLEPTVSCDDRVYTWGVQKALQGSASTGVRIYGAQYLQSSVSTELSIDRA